MHGCWPRSGVSARAPNIELWQSREAKWQWGPELCKSQLVISSMQGASSFAHTLQ